MTADNSQIIEEDLKLFPDYKIFCENLKKLEKFDFTEKSNEEIYNTFFDLACLLPASYGIFNPNKFNYHKFYRVRLKRQIDPKEDLNLISTYSFPPSNVCFENGRANLAHKSVFYCSNDPRGAMLESKPQDGDEGFLSVWSGNASRKIKVNICLPNNLPPTNYWNMLAKDKFDFLKEHIPVKARDKFKHYLKLYDFIADRFVNENKPYHLTSMISHQLLFEELTNDLIIYPSVISNSSLCNMAFHPNTVSENLKFEKVIRFKVKNIINEQVIFNLGKVGYLESSKMKWRNAENSEKSIFIENEN